MVFANAGSREIRYLIATCGVLMSLPLILFFWIGAQTFVRPKEKAAAVALFWFGTVLLALSLLTFLHPNLAAWEAFAVGAAVIVYLTLWLVGKRSRRRP